MSRQRAWMVRLFVAVICSALWWGISPSRTGARQAQAKGEGKVSGRVISDSGHPIRGAQVMLQGVTPGTQGLSRYGMTNREGRFSFRSLPPGTYRLVASQRGYFPAPQDAQPSASQITIADGQDLKEVELHLVRGGAITGRVTDEEGEPLIGSRVTVLRKNPNGGAYQVNGAETDDRGVYRVYGLQEGDYFLYASIQSIDAGRSSNSSMYYPGVKSEKEAEAIHLSAGDEVEDIDFEVKDSGGFTLSGKVINAATGGGIGDASVRLYGANVSLSVETSEDGSYEFSGLSKGAFMLQAAVPQQSFLPFQRSITLESTDLLNQDIQLEAGAEIRGKIVLAGGRPFENPQSTTIQARVLKDPEDGGVPQQAFIGDRGAGGSWARGVYLFPFAPESYSSTQTGEVLPDGTFSIRGLHSGNVRLVVMPSSSRYYFKDIQIGTRSFGRTPLAVSPGEVKEGVTLVLSDDVGAVRGILQPASVSAGRVIISLLPVDKEKWTDPSALRQTSVDATTNSKITFTLTEVPVGQYYVLAVPQLSVVSKPEELEAMVQTSAVVSVRPQETAEITVFPSRIP